MKQLVIAGFLSLFAFGFAAQPAAAKIPIPIVYSSGDDVDLVHKFTADESAALGIPEDVHLGWMHYQFELLWMPFWAGGEGDYVLYQETSDGYAVETLGSQDVAMIGALINKEMDDSYSGGMIGNFWGWGVVLGIAVLGFLGTRS